MIRSAEFSRVPGERGAHGLLVVPQGRLVASRGRLVAPRGLILAALGVLIWAGGCARTLQSVDSARDAFASGNLALADETLRKHAQKQGRFSDAASLDLAVVELASGNPAAAEQRLRELRDRFENRAEIAPVREAAAIATDDTARRFDPAGYEEVMIRAMLAVCSLANDQVDAESYTLQAVTKQAELAQRAEERGVSNLGEAYQPIAFAPYLRGVLREATHHDYDDAARAYQLVSAFRPQFAPAQADLQRASGGTHSRPGNGVLYVLACVGRGPVLRESVAPTTTVSLQIASAILNAETNEEEDDDDGDVPALPNIASVKVPEVSIPATDIGALGVSVDGALVGATQTLTDVGELAIKQTESEMPWTIARAVVRRVTKEATVAKLGDSLGLSGDAGSIFHFAASSAWSGIEQADTRCWGLLPREIQVLRAELPAGTHRIDLSPIDMAGGVKPVQVSETITVTDGRNHYVIVIAPGETMYVAH